MKTLAHLVVILLAGAALAGCAQQERPPADDDPADVGDYALATTGVPSTVAAGERFEFTLDIDGPEATSDHIGAHYGTSAADPPNTTAYDRACDHQPGEVPGTFTVACTIAEAGTWHLRGHLRLGTEGDYAHFWGPDHTVVVTPAANLTTYMLTASGVPEQVDVGENFTFTLTVVGPPAFSDHIGAHYGANFSSEPSTAVYDRACLHQEGDLPGTFDVTCTIAEAGTWHLRGHMRLNATNYWTDEDFEVVVGDGDDASVAAVEDLRLLGATGALNTVTAGDDATLCWTVRGNGTIPHVAIHWDTESHADEDNVTFQAYDEGLRFPDNRTSAAADGYALSAEGSGFCTDLPVPEGATELYVVAHAMVTPPGRISEELRLTVAPL